MTYRFISIYLFLWLMFILYIRFELLAPFVENSQRQDDEAEKESYSLRMRNNEKYIQTNEMCAGLGNQFYRFASLVRLGQQLNRVAQFHGSEECVREIKFEFLQIFPKFSNQIQFADVNTPDEDLSRTMFASDCCRYENPKKLKNIPAKILVLSGSPALQNYKYFHAIRPQIRKLFECDVDVQAKLHVYARKLFEDSNPEKLHKICVHVRRGDFVPLGLASDLNYTNWALSQVIRMEEQQLTKNPATRNQQMSILLLGQDKRFLHQIRTNQTRIPVHISTKKLNRGEDLCLGVHHCDSLLITAHASTYSFWMGYLMGERSRVYYNANFNIRTPYTRENFLPEWTPLVRKQSFE